MTTEKDVLIKAKQILATPAHWTRGSFARDVRNKPVASQSVQACQFCTIGALRRATLELAGPTPAGMELASKASGLLQSSLPKGVYGVETFNDSLKTTHKDVLKLFDKAIAS